MKMTVKENSRTTAVQQGPFALNEDIEPGTYRFQYYVKPSNAAQLNGVKAWIGASATTNGSERRQKPLPFCAKAGEWYRCDVEIELSANANYLWVYLYAEWFHGSLWFDDLSFYEAPDGLSPAQSLFHYDPRMVQLDATMSTRFDNVNADFIAAAQAYNELLVKVSNTVDLVERLFRAGDYLSQINGQKNKASKYRNDATTLEADLDSLYQRYGEYFVNEDLSALPSLIADMSALANTSDALKAQLNSEFVNFRNMAGASTAPPSTPLQDIEFSSKGKPNQIVISAVTRQHMTAAEVLGISRVHSTLADWNYLGNQSAAGLDFNAVIADINTLTNSASTGMNVEYATFATSIAGPWDKTGVPPSLETLANANPGSIMLKPRNGNPVAWDTEETSQRVNTLHPTVREAISELIQAEGAAVNNSPSLLWWTTSAENYGAHFNWNEQMHSMGYNETSVNDFRAWLESIYGPGSAGIAGLNNDWRRSRPYASYAEIEPPTDLNNLKRWTSSGHELEPWLKSKALGYHFQTWRFQRHNEWLKFVYDEMKSAAPEKMVFSSHNHFLESMHEVFETADIVGFHTQYRRSSFAAVYMHGLNRFYNKQLGQWELQQGAQLGMNRRYDERAHKKSIEQHVFRMASWDVFVQGWWYSHTLEDYMLRYNGNWFNPIYDLTTLRYSAGAVPVAKNKLEAVQDALLNSAIPRSKIAVIDPPTTRLFQPFEHPESRVIAEMIEAHELLYEINQHYDVIPEEFFINNRARLNDYKVLILPYMSYFPDQLSDKLRIWVENGGLLIGLGPFGMFDKYGYADGSLWTTLFNGPPPQKVQGFSWSPKDWSWNQADNPSNVVEANYGTGRVISTLSTLRRLETKEDSTTALRDAIASKTSPLAHSPKNKFDLVVRRKKDGTAYVCVLNRDLDEHVTDTVYVQGQYGEAKDVILHFPVPIQASKGASSFKITLGPGDFTVIELQSGAIEGQSPEPGPRAPVQRRR